MSKPSKPSFKEDYYFFLLIWFQNFSLNEKASLNFGWNQFVNPKDYKTEIQSICDNHKQVE